MIPPTVLPTKFDSWEYVLYELELKAREWRYEKES